MPVLMLTDVSLVGDLGTIVGPTDFGTLLDGAMIFSGNYKDVKFSFNPKDFKNLNAMKNIKMHYNARYYSYTYY